MVYMCIGRCVRIDRQTDIKKERLAQDNPLMLGIVLAHPHPTILHTYHVYTCMWQHVHRGDSDDLHST